MKIAVVKESHPGEQRVPLIPASADKLVQLGAEVVIESGVGLACFFQDADYVQVGVQVASSREEMLQTADMVLRLRKPPADTVELMQRGCIHISYLDPFHETELVTLLQKAGISALSLEMLPRTTLAQKMDALSSQANLAGYAAVILGAEYLPKILPMMTTPAGTIKPARVFVLGGGVAGLQAIATARRLGAVVEAFDIRPAVEEQIKSLGAKFLKMDLGPVEQTKDGYAKALSPEQLALQREGMAKACARADLVITTAQVFGQPAPRIIDAKMLAGMQPGSVVIDMAVESGGNVEGSEADAVKDIGGVQVLGFANLPARVALSASQMYSSNLVNFVEHFWDKEAKTFHLNQDDEIIQGALITHQGAIVNTMYTSIINS
jgi:NAD(P) transhydrogenase subunit alpha